MSRHTATIIKALCLLASGTLLSCGDNDSQGISQPIGRLDISIEFSGAVASSSGGGDIIIDDIPDTGTASLTVKAIDHGESHTWEDAGEYPEGQYMICGQYSVEAAIGDPRIEGFDVTAWKGDTLAVVTPDGKTQSVIRIRPVNAFAGAMMPVQLPRDVDDISLMIHTPGGRFHTITREESRLLRLNPGDAEVYARLEMAGAHDAVMFPVLTLKDTRPTTLYTIAVGFGTSSSGITELKVSCGNHTSSTSLDESFLNSKAPEITSTWDPAQTYTLPEGDVPAQSFIATVSPGTQIRSLKLSVSSQYLEDAGFPVESDLMDLTPAEKQVMNEFSFTPEISAAGGSIDFTSLLSRIAFLSEATAGSVFTIECIDSRGMASTPLSLEIKSEPVEMEVVKIYPVTMGIDRARVEIRCNSSNFASNIHASLFDTKSQSWHEVSDLTVDPEPSDPTLHYILFDVMQQSAPQQLRLLYCDEVRTTISIPMVQPDFDIEVDPFATMAAIKVVAADPRLTEAITRNAIIYINNTPMASYVSYPERGIITVIGLNSATPYSVKATMMSGVSDPKFTPAVSIVTESTLQLPNSDFEERRDGPSFSHLPSGGKYAQTVVDIFNWQHFTDISTEVPKNWATTNAKTFAPASANKNTWYMQPSAVLTRDPVFSQSFAVKLTSVAFDPKGAVIPPYSQTGQPYLDYSPIIPDIAYRAAGKLFLGSYSFDASTATEVYNEGVDWSTRPTSVNGYYRFIPSEGARSDYGLVTVEVIGVSEGAETTIASGNAQLPLALSYTAFNVPLEYTVFGAKATRLKVMFSSSSSPGSIEHETATVVTVPDARTASSTGSQLWIDNVTLAY